MSEPNSGWRMPQDVPKELHSHAQELKLLLIMVPYRSHATIGWYIGGSVQQWYEMGACSPVQVIMWQPLPELPYNPIVRKRHDPSWNPTPKATATSSKPSSKRRSTSKAKSP